MTLTLLYTKEGMTDDQDMGRVRERERKGFREGNGEEAKKDRELEWGRGNLESQISFHKCSFSFVFPQRFITGRVIFHKSLYKKGHGKGTCKSAL